jgi:hypothetical protein
VAAGIKRVQPKSETGRAGRLAPLHSDPAVNFQRVAIEGCWTFGQEDCPTFWTCDAPPSIGSNMPRVHDREWGGGMIGGFGNNRCLEAWRESIGRGLAGAQIARCRALTVLWMLNLGKSRRRTNLVSVAGDLDKHGNRWLDLIGRGETTLIYRRA